MTEPHSHEAPGGDGAARDLVPTGSSGSEPQPPRMIASAMSAVAIVAVVGVFTVMTRTTPSPSLEPAQGPVEAAVQVAEPGGSEVEPRTSAGDGRVGQPDTEALRGSRRTSAERDARWPGLPISAQWAERIGGRTGIPARPLASYAAASVRLEGEQPGCGLGWPTLAAIGAVESSHGTFGGTGVEADGRTADPIIGIALDGSAGVAAIGDTDGGALDGDTAWDRAVGPMQFIPTTWDDWSADGNGDGTADPHNIDDAALAAGRYLCAAGGDLSDGDGWRQAVLSYNRSGEYADSVLETANEYARASWG